jgi:hypothetical protein
VLTTIPANAIEEDVTDVALISILPIGSRVELFEKIYVFPFGLFPITVVIASSAEVDSAGEEGLCTLTVCTVAYV